MSMLGANYDELEAAAVRMRQAADELDAHAKSIQGTIGGLSWLGQVATNFLAMWNGNHRAHLSSTASFIRDAATKLEQQARQQREASESSAPATLGSGWPGTGGSGGDRGTILPQLPPGFLDYLQERYGNGATLIDIVTKYSQYGEAAHLKDLLKMSDKIDLPGVIGVGSFGIDIVQWVDSWDTNSGFEIAQDGVGIVIDGVGIAFPVVGLAKGTWDLTYWGTSNAVQWADRTFGTSDAFIASVVAREGQVPNYDGVSGFFNYLGDGVQNLFSRKSWGF